MKIIARDEDAPLVASVLAAFPPALAVLVEAHCDVVRILEPTERFADVGKTYASADRIDYGVCGGLYDPRQRTVIIKDRNPYVTAHELVHAVDHVLGDGTKPRSLLDPDVDAAYRRHRRDGVAISAYSMVNRVEFVAEHLRALLGFSPPRPPGRPSDIDRVRRVDAALCTAFEDWLRDAEMIAKEQAA
jgi:hypothetical protein